MAGAHSNYWLSPSSCHSCCHSRRPAQRRLRWSRCPPVQDSSRRNFSTGRLPLVAIEANQLRWALSVPLCRSVCVDWLAFRSPLLAVAGSSWLESFAVASGSVPSFVSRVSLAPSLEREIPLFPRPIFVHDPVRGPAIRAVPLSTRFFLACLLLLR